MCEQCRDNHFDSVAVRLTEIERNIKTGGLVFPKDEAMWLLSTLRQKMAECEELKGLLGEYRKELMQLHLEE